MPEIRKDMEKIRLKDIADSLGVSQSTVSRALDGSSKISEKTITAIRKKARELGYEPPTITRINRQAAPIHIAVLCPYDIFFETVIAGMNAAREEFKAFNVHIDYKFFAIYDVVEQTKQLREITADTHYNGIAIAPAHSVMLDPLIDELVENGKHVVTFNTDAPHSARSLYIGQNAFAASSIAAQICGSQLRQGEDVAVINSFSPTMALKDRTEGFLNFINNNYPFVKALGPFDFNDTIENARDITEQIILMNKDIKAIYANNMVGTIGSARAVEVTGNRGRILVFGHDGNDEIERFIKEGIIFATVLQEPFRQGYQSIRLLLKRLIYGTKPGRQYFYTKADLLMKSTLEFQKTAIDAEMIEGDA